ncbi:carbohydrate ABC transporter permease [Schumannella soli]|uniref:Sugar ABC transporter permease n=1 Tax=Schumannella soli TaxID=2590779 RepID=A0A506Y150_9MICO|nr:sugar ABC transporter permease [Schumannella soli]TPW74668.1 sugar ABC transporter permease [Schumannella soli]
MSLASKAPVAAPPALTPAGRRRRGHVGLPLALLVPSTVVLAVVIGWPLIQLVIQSFQQYGRAQVFGAPAPFIGFQNYANVLSDPKFWNVLGRSVLFCVVCVVITIVLGTLVALLMQRLNKGFRTLLSIGLLLAWAMPPLSATFVWGWVFDTQYGVANYLLTQVTGTNWMGHSWLISAVGFFFVAGVIVVWGAIPFIAFTVYAGLTQVPDEVLEAAQLDGAGALARFRLIVLPYLRSIFLVLIVLSTIWDLRVFAQIQALQAIGGSIAETSTIGVYIYQTSLANGEYGTGGAIAVILVLILMAVSFVYIRQSLKEDEA